MKLQKKKIIAYNIFVIIILAILTIISMIAINYDQTLILYLGKVGESKNPFTSQYKTDEELREAQEKTAAQIVDEGSVLLKNNSAIPLANKSKITIFGQASVYWSNGAIGSTSMNIVPNMTLQQSLENSGFLVNNEVWDYYKNSGITSGPGGSGQSNDWNLNETSFSILNDKYGNTFSNYNDAALFVISRIGCEGGDLPREMSRFDGLASEHYLELSSTEKEILKGIKEAGFKKTIVLIKSSFMIDADFIDDPELGVDACFYCASTGNNGIEEIGKILKGTVNPSGHLANIMVFDNFSSPAMQNLGDFRYVDKNGELVSPKYNYINYGETIYVGYRYYETRYEDKILQQGNAGEFNYTEEVKYPFGYGLSLTTFEYSNYKVDIVNNIAKISLNVKNTGNVKGKDAIQIYYQSPYTDYDVLNKVEKSSINLATFEKTVELMPNESTLVELEFNIKDIFKSYDYLNEKAYILEEGDYYIALGENSHDALNNILADKGFTKKDGMTEEGNSNFAFKYHINETEIIDNDDVTKYEVTNRFDDCIAKNATYLTRNDWSIMDNNGLRYATGKMKDISYTTDADGTIYTTVADDELIENLKNIGYYSTGRPEETFNKSEAITSVDKGIKFADMDGVEYNDPKWDEFVQQMSVSEMHKLYNTAGYGTKAVDSVSLPSTKIFDGGIGLVNYVSDRKAYAYPDTTMLATSFNKELAKKTGELIAEDAMRWGVTGWYAPAVNIQRTPFSGRNFDYFSEDPILTGLIAGNEIIGAQEHGLIAFVKHFAANDEETERSNCSVWFTEQSFREIYLKPFEICVKKANAHGLMASMNRIGFRYTRGSYPLMTEVLRNEWGFKGATITDFTSTNKEYSDMSLAAGIDMQLDTSPNALTQTKSNEIRHDLQRAAKNISWMITQSLIMNGLRNGQEYNEGFPVYQIILIVVNSSVCVGLIIEEALLITSYVRKKKALKILDGE